MYLKISCVESFSKVLVFEHSMCCRDSLQLLTQMCMGFTSANCAVKDLSLL